MLNTSNTLDPAFVVGPVRGRTSGTSVEHLGRCDDASVRLGCLR